MKRGAFIAWAAFLFAPLALAGPGYTVSGQVYVTNGQSVVERSVTAGYPKVTGGVQYGLYAPRTVIVTAPARSNRVTALKDAAVPAATTHLADAQINAELAKFGASSTAVRRDPVAARPILSAAARTFAVNDPPVRAKTFLPGLHGARAVADFRHFRRHFFWDGGHVLIIGDDDLLALDGAPPGDTFDGSVVAQVQQALHAQGYYDGPIDGALDLGLRRAIGDYQFDHKLVVSGVIDEALLGSLGLLDGAALMN